MWLWSCDLCCEILMQIVEYDTLLTPENYLISNNAGGDYLISNMPLIPRECIWLLVHLFSYSFIVYLQLPSENRGHSRRRNMDQILLCIDDWLYLSKIVNLIYWHINFVFLDNLLESFMKFNVQGDIQLTLILHSRNYS